MGQKKGFRLLFNRGVLLHAYLTLYILYFQIKRMPYTKQVWTLSSRVKGELTEEHFTIKVTKILKTKTNYNKEKKK